MKRYKVIKDITEGWESSAKVGETLTVRRWEGFPTLMKGSKAICDDDSPYAREHCIVLDSETNESAQGDSPEAE